MRCQRCRIVILSRFVALSVSLIQKVSPFQGVSKLWGENLGRMYYDEYNLSVLCIRMGHVSASGKPGWGSNYEEGNPASLGRDISIYTSHRDIAQMVRKCVEAPDSVGFDVFYALSNNKRGYRDIQHAKDVIGFEPQDSAEDYY